MIFLNYVSTIKPIIALFSFVTVTAQNGILSHTDHEDSYYK